MIVASSEPGVVYVPPGVYYLHGAGDRSNGNGAAVCNNFVVNPNGVPLSIKGVGRGLTVFRLQAGNEFNLFECVNTAGDDIRFLPFTLEGMTLDGSSNSQHIDGDRYQNGVYACGVRGLKVADVECLANAYHGVALNACHDAVTDVDSHHNRCNGVLLTGNVESDLWGMGGEHRFRVWHNGESSQQIDTTYMGVVIIAQRATKVSVVSRGHPNHVLNAITPDSGGAVFTHHLMGSHVDIVSAGDYAALTIGQYTYGNTFNVTATGVISAQPVRNASYYVGVGPNSINLTHV